MDICRGSLLDFTARSRYSRDEAAIILVHFIDATVDIFDINFLDAFHISNETAIFKLI